MMCLCVCFWSLLWSLPMIGDFVSKAGKFDWVKPLDIKWNRASFSNLSFLKACWGFPKTAREVLEFDCLSGCFRSWKLGRHHGSIGCLGQKGLLLGCSLKSRLGCFFVNQFWEGFWWEGFDSLVCPETEAITALHRPPSPLLQLSQPSISVRSGPGLMDSESGSNIR